jgi:hypothetical protein
MSDPIKKGRRSAMFFMDCMLALIKELPSFIDLIVRHGIEILSAL